MFILIELITKDDEYDKIQNKQYEKDDGLSMHPECAADDLTEDIRQDDQGENEQKRRHASVKYPFHHLQPGFIVTEDLFLPPHLGGWLAEVAVAYKILEIFPAAVLEQADIFFFVGNAVGIII